MKSVKTAILVAICVCLFGCEQQQKKEADKPLKADTALKVDEPLKADQPRDAGKVFLSVDFEKGQVSKYKFTSDRQIALHWDPMPDESKPAAKNKVDYTNEKVEIVMAYEPTEVNPYGLTTIKCSCESVNVEQTSSKKKKANKADAIKYFVGKSFNLIVGPTGKIEDYSGFERVLNEVGEKAFRAGREGVRIKEPDLIEDIIASQWFLWDSISSLGSAGSEGIKNGFKWRSVLSAPTPLITTQARSVEYQLSEIKNSPSGKQLVIKSTYSPADRKVISWPMPYSGRFQVSGPFGFLTMFIKNFQVTSLQGSGVEVLKADTGQAVRYKQDYNMVLEAAGKSSLGTKPRLEIKQNFTMELLAQ